METVVPVPAVINYFLVGLPLLTIVMALLLRGRPLIHRVLPVVVVCATCGLFYRFGVRPMRFSWDQQGIVDETFRDARRISWSDVREARLIRNFNSTEFCPRIRTNGAAYSGYRSGVFQLANGMSVRVFIVPETSDAILVTTGDSVYLYAPPAFERFREAVEAGTAKNLSQ